jgi:predicted nucleic acid-binding protein
LVIIDTSALIASLSGPRKSLPALRQLLEQRQRIVLTTIILYEWLRGPRTPRELSDQEDLFPAESAVSFGNQEALLAADLYKRVRRARGREIDLAIAACAMAREASLWTLNREDFSDVPGLVLANPGTI